MQEPMEKTQEAYQWAAKLCQAAGEKEDFLEPFWNRLLEEPDIYEEFVFFLEHQDFLCRAKVEDMTIVDVMVWQIDHFKAELDRDSQTRTNKDRMLLKAFDTMLRMRNDAEPYLKKIRSETGTDYPGKL